MQQLRGRHQARFGAALTGLFVVAIACIASGCSSNGTATASPRLALASYDATIAASSAVIRFSSTTQIGSLGTTSTAGSGSYSWAANMGRLDATLSGSASGAESGQSTELVIGRVTYVRSSFSSSSSASSGMGSFPAGWTQSTWSGKGLNPLAFLTEVGLGFASPDVPNPVQILQLLRVSRARVREIGTQIIDGVQTTHFVSDVPVQFVDLGASPSHLAQDRRAFGGSAFPVDFWVDTTQRLRQIRVALDIRSNPDPSQPVMQGILPVRSTYTLGLSDYGVSVHVTAPPSSQIVNRETCTATEDSNSCGSREEGAATSG